MATCKELSPGMLPNPIDLETDDKRVDFMQAKRIAEDQARSKASDPMLLAWYNGETGQFSPDVICCGEEKPTWLVYAESRGGDLSIRINDGQYVFVFRSGEESI
jgi:hypothetical protein